MPNQQGRKSDTERIIKALAGSERGLTNSYLKSELNLSDERYFSIREELLCDGDIEKYRCRGGGIHLTGPGEKKAHKYKKVVSKVPDEKALYSPLCELLHKNIKEDDLTGIVIDTSSLCKKGKWQNPDVLQVIKDRYEYLAKEEIVLTSFEVKQWGGWDTRVVFEAASHRRFVHKSVVVLEWSAGVDFSMSDTTYKMDEIARECRRFGVGLSTLHPWYSSWRLHMRIEPEPHEPSNSDVEEGLEYVFSRNEKAKTSFMKTCREEN